MAVAVEGDAGVGVACDGLDEFDVGAGGDETADAGVAEVVEAVDGFAVGVGEFGVAECGLPGAAVEVGWVDWFAVFGLEEQFVGGVGAVFDGAGGEGVECALDGGEDRDGADSGSGFGAFELVAGVGAFDVDESLLAVDVAPLEGA